MRRRAQSYRTIEGVTQERDGVAWYWRIVALGSSFIILGGYLMLPVTFEDDAKLRISKQVLGIFAVALLTAGFSFTALLCFAVRNPLFQADAIFLPSLVSCATGLLTVFYDFLVSARYQWNTPALLLTIAASITTIIYGGLLIWTHRKIGLVRAKRSSMTMPLRPNSMSSSIAPPGAWQDQTFYENYNRNMFPTSVRDPPQMGYDPNQITEEEMQRQQMLMLLLQKEQHPSPDPSQSTFRIDWQGRDDEDGPPPNGWYAPQPQTAYTPQTAFPQTAYPHPGLARQWTGMSQALQPWDGVWREPLARGRAADSVQQWENRAASRERREERRREIEMGMR